MKGWKEEGQSTKEGEHVLRQMRSGGGTQSKATLRPYYFATLLTTKLH